MGQALNLLADWAALDPEKNKALEENLKVLTRWLNSAQESHAEISRCIQRDFRANFVQNACQLPDDFVKFKEDLILLENNRRLNMIPYEQGVAAQVSYPNFYSIHDNQLFVWGATTQSPVIPYLARPSELNAASVKTEDLEIPKEFQNNLLYYLDAMWARTKGDTKGWAALMKLFNQAVVDDAISFQDNRIGVQSTRGSML